MLFATVTVAKDKPTAAALDCDLGDSLLAAVQSSDNELLIEFDGTCTENIAVDRGNLTIRGLSPSAVIAGAVTVGQTNPSAGLRPSGPVLLENLTITNSSANGLVVTAAAVVTAKDITVTNSALSGIVVSDSGSLSCENCEATGHTTNQVSGILAWRNGTALLSGTGNFSSNFRGIQVGDSGQLSMEGASITANSNLSEGIIVFDGGSIRSDNNTTIVADTNLGSGILVGTGASGLIDGTVTVSNNDLGIFSLAGKLLFFANVNATGNRIGLLATESGTLRLAGAVNNVDQSTLWGVFVDGSYLSISNATITNSASFDNWLVFGAKAKYTGTSAVGTVFCDDATKISVQGAACPVIP
jgi:hypothetical protein